MPIALGDLEVRDAREAQEALVTADIQRWASVPSVALWNRRTDVCIDLLARHRSTLPPRFQFLDLGCGAQYAKEALLVRGFEVDYLPYDCVSRGPGTFVCDLDHDIPLLPVTDLVYLGGVLEYVEAPMEALAALGRKAGFVLVAYCVHPGIDGKAATTVELLQACHYIGTVIEMETFTEGPYPVAVLLVDCRRGL